MRKYVLLYLEESISIQQNLILYTGKHKKLFYLAHIFEKEI